MKVVLTNGIEKEMSIHTPTLGYRIKSVTFTAKDMAELYDHSRKGLDLNEWFGILGTRFPPPVEEEIMVRRKPTRANMAFLRRHVKFDKDLK